MRILFECKCMGSERFLQLKIGHCSGAENSSMLNVKFSMFNEDTVED
jgi:hypothetical protein